jgi:anthraniloyl-CoA monooxygenase
MILDTGAPDRTAATPHVLTNPVKPALALADTALADAIMAAASRTTGIVVDRDGERILSPCQLYTFIGAGTLASILRDKAEALGCRIDTSATAGKRAASTADLIVIADGMASETRSGRAEGFKPSLAPARTRAIVFALERPAAQPSLLFRRTDVGIFHAFHYPEGPQSSCLVVEATPVTIAAAGLDRAAPETIAQFCSKLFATALDGSALSPKGRGWQQFASVRNATWTDGNAVLIGAAAYNAHVSIGLGARSGLEDAEALATLLDGKGALEDGLSRFEAARRPRADSLQRASAASLVWFENTHRYYGMPLQQFAYSCLTRSMRINHEAMRGLAPDLTEAVEGLIAGGATTRANRPPPPMFSPITLRGLTIPNRIAMSPMCMYNADDGAVGDFHLVHYGSRAVGGAGLIITEMTDVSPEGRISAHCAGMYKPEHAVAWRRVTDFVHAKSNSKIGVQLGHAGRKGAEPRPWERAGHKGPAWQTIAPSAIPFQDGGVPPREVERADMDRLVAAYANAARMADEAGFDLIELHFAHGYLLSTFISPLSNRRTDNYGGSLANRLRFPMEVFEAVRAAWPQDKPISVRISAHDWMEGGTTVEDAIAIGRMLKDAGNDILSVSTGGVVGVRPTAGRLYQATFSDQVRNELGITTMNVGGMASHGDINAMIAAGRADMCALARGHLFDPYFTRHAAYQQGYDDLPWPNEYERAASLAMRDF